MMVCKIADSLSRTDAYITDVSSHLWPLRHQE
jgi:hypothetical protein